MVGSGGTRDARAQDRLIVALDVPTAKQALALADDVTDVVSFFKVGYQLFLAEGMPLVRELRARGSRVFLDLKIDDVEETIRLAVAEVARNDIEFLTIHGGAATARSAVAGRGGGARPRLLFVTLLSSLNETDLTEIGVLGAHSRFGSLDAYVQWRAAQALAAGVEGFIASGASVAALRAAVGPAPLIVTPGIRPGGRATDEHKRAMTPALAIRAGADYLVVGRPVRDAADRRAAAQGIVDEIAEALAAVGADAAR